MSQSQEAWKPVFAYLEQEIKFVAAAATLTGAVAGWWLKGILTPAQGVPPASLLTRFAAGLLTLSAFLFLMDEARLSKRYGDLARCLAKGEEIGDGLTNNLVRDIRVARATLQWLPYYAARALLYVVGAILLVMLYRGSA